MPATSISLVDLVRDRITRERVESGRSLSPWDALYLLDKERSFELYPSVPERVGLMPRKAEKPWERED